jgi:hypothetical protein
VEWSVLEKIFIAIFGHEARSLKTYPDTLQSVYASWVDADSVEHTATTLSEVEEAYRRQETAIVRFNGKSQRLEWCSFNYRPGGKPPRAAVDVRGPPGEVDAMIAPVEEAFPLQRSVLFLSWSGSRSRRVAEVLSNLLERKMPPGAEIFFSPEIRPGANPLKEMMDRNLLVADAHIVVVTREAGDAPWVTWEVASSWGRQKTVIPLFVGVDPNDVEGPLKHLVQGVKLEDRKQLTRAIEVLVSALGGTVDSPLSPEEVASLQHAAE